jgi:hypothetical protein
MVHHTVLIHFIKDSPSEKTLICGVLRRLALAEQRHQPVAELLSDFAAHFADTGRSGVEIGATRSHHFFGTSLTAMPAQLEFVQIGGAVRTANGRCWPRP